MQFSSLLYVTNHSDMLWHKFLSSNIWTVWYQFVHSSDWYTDGKYRTIKINHRWMLGVSRFDIQVGYTLKPTSHQMTFVRTHNMDSTSTIFSLQRQHFDEFSNRWQRSPSFKQWKDHVQVLSHTGYLHLTFNLNTWMRLLNTCRAGSAALPSFSVNGQSRAWLSGVSGLCKSTRERLFQMALKWQRPPCRLHDNTLKIHGEFEYWKPYTRLWNL